MTNTEAFLLAFPNGLGATPPNPDMIAVLLAERLFHDDAVGCKEPSSLFLALVI